MYLVQVKKNSGSRFLHRHRLAVLPVMFLMYKYEFNELHSSLRGVCRICPIRVLQLQYLGGVLRFSLRRYLKTASDGTNLISSERNF